MEDILTADQIKHPQRSRNSARLKQQTHKTKCYSDTLLFNYLHEVKYDHQTITETVH